MIYTDEARLNRKFTFIPRFKIILPGMLIGTPFNIHIYEQLKFEINSAIGYDL